MITAARPTDISRPHYYKASGEPVFGVPNKSKPGELRAVTVRDARALSLVPSPTTVVRLLHRHALVQWMCEQACLAVLTTPRKEGESLDAFVERVIQTDRVQDEEKNVAAERGKMIHRAIQDYLISAREISGEMSAYVNPAVRAIGSVGRVVATEKTVVGDGYCGMADIVCENDSEVWIHDIKTSKNIPNDPYDEQKLQVSAYCAALGNTGDKRVRGMIVYVSTSNPGEIKTVEVDWQSDYRRFKLLLEFFRLSKGM